MANSLLLELATRQGLQDGLSDLTGIGTASARALFDLFTNTTEIVYTI